MPVKSTTTKTATVTKETAPVKKFKQDEVIMCRSITVGGLWLDGMKSKNIYRWVEYGDEVEVEYRDLAAMVRSRSSYIFKPMFIILDEDFIKEFPQLNDFYNNQYTTGDLKEVLDLPVTKMISAIKTLPAGAVESLKNIAATQVANGQLDSVKKIKALDELFGTELNLLASLFQ